MRRIFTSVVLVVFVGISIGIAPRSVYATTCANDGSVTFTVVGSTCVGIITALPSGTFGAPSDWNNASNTIEAIGGGGGGGNTVVVTSGRSTGGGGGGYSAIYNYSFASPGVSTSTYQIGAGGAGITGTVGVSASISGNNGGSTWFGAASLAACVTAGSTSCVAAAGGGGGPASPGTTNMAGGTGGLASSGVGTKKTSGGSGGSTATWGVIATGGGGAGGSTGDGTTAPTSTVNGQGSNGGGGDTGGTGAGIGGTGTTAVNTATTGGNGTEWAATPYGSGGGGGGASLASNSASGGNYDGGSYGAGGGGCENKGGGNNRSTNCASGSGKNGILVITYTPVSTSSAPTVTTNAVTGIGSFFATFSGTISNNGGSDAIDHGYAYSTDSTLATVIATTTLGGFTGTGSFSQFINILQPSTTYYVRAFATNSTGTGYGSIQSFATSYEIPARTLRLISGKIIINQGSRMIINQQ